MQRKPRIVERTERAVDDRTRPRHTRKYAGDDGPAGDPGTLAGEQVRESNEGWAGPGVAMMSDGQAKGLVAGMLLGGLIGALVALPFGLISWGGLAVGWRLLFTAIVGALAGGTAGAIYWGGRMPELQGETVDADNRPSTGSTPRDPRMDARGR